MEYYSAIKENKRIPLAATSIDLEIIVLSEVSQTKTNTIRYHVHVESKKNDTDKLIYKREREYRGRKETYGHQGMEGEG